VLRSLIPYAATHGTRPFQAYFPDMLWRTDTQSRVVHLTFDDGPTPEMTEDLLARLRAYDARATFFLIGDHAQDHPDLVEQIHRGGHRIGNHTFTHPDAWTTPTDALLRELSATTQTLEQITEAPVRVLRPPYGKFTRTMREWSAVQNQQIVMWDVMPGDYLQTATAEGVARFVVRHVRPGSIVVLHDNPICTDVTPAALDTILATLSREGWSFGRL